ncbi:MAG TPA: hypothetical protein VF681_01915 [Abditibacteriaceae bacterium]
MTTSSVLRRCCAAFLSLAAIVFLWAPTLALYGSALFLVVSRAPLRLLEALPISPVARTLFFNSVSLAALTAFFASLLGFICGVVLARAPHKVRSISGVLCALPLALPPMVMASAWLELVRQPPARAMGAFAATQPAFLPPVVASAIVLALCFFPIVAFATRATLLSLPRESDEAALAFGSDWQAWWRVRGPHCARAVGGAAALVAALALWEMGAPDLLDCRTYSVQIYRDLNAADALDPAGKSVKAALAAFPMFLLSALLLVPISRALACVRSGGHAQHQSPHTTGFVIVAALVFCASPLAPVLLFARQAQPASIFSTVARANSSELINTVVLALAGATLCSFWAFALATAWRNWPQRVRRVLLWTCAGAACIAPVMLGIALVQTLNQPAFDIVYRGLEPTGNRAFDSFAETVARLAPVLIAYGARFLPLAILLANEAASRVDTSWLEAAHGLGADEHVANRTILKPLLRTAHAAIWTIIVALCAGELSTSVLVNSPGGQTATLPIFNQMHIGATAEVAALSLLVFAFSGVAAVISLLISGYGRIRPYFLKHEN